MLHKNGNHGWVTAYDERGNQIAQIFIWTASVFPRSKAVCSNYFADGVGRFARCPSAEVFPTSALRNTMFYAPEANQLDWPLHCFDDRGGSGACARVVFVCRAPGRPSQAT